MKSNEKMKFKDAPSNPIYVNQIEKVEEIVLKDKKM